MPRLKLSDVSISLGKLLASYWLDTKDFIKKSDSSAPALRQFAERRGFSVSDEDLQKAAVHLDGEMSEGDPNRWVVFICFFGHPHALWNFMMDAMSVASCSNDYHKIATELAEHILAHYGSMIGYFEKIAKADNRFVHMLTGVWRHRMSDDVWMRLRAIQAQDCDPLPMMIPLENGVDYMAHSLSEEDRTSPDKGRYILDAEGNWVRRIP